MKINIIEYLENSASLFKDKTAVKDADKSLSFSELRNNALIIANQIAKLGLLNKPVAVFMPKSCDMVVSFAAINYSGNFYVPMDTKSPDFRVKNIIAALESDIIITTNEYKDRVSALTTAQLLIFEDLLAESDNSDAIINRTLNNVIDTDPVYSIFTSGSTGNPKGVVVSHRGVIDYIDWAINTFDVTDKEVIGNQAPFYFDNSTLDLYLMFATGATLVIVPEEIYIFPAKLIDFLNENQINFVFWVPFVLINVANFDILSKKSLPYFKKVLFAGEVMPNKHLNYWRKHMPDCMYANLYGPTEITVDCTYYIVDRPFSDDESLPIGFPCKNSGILILNEHNNRCAIEEHGELCVRGSSLALGYYNDPEKTAAAFIQNPLNKYYPEIIYKTGDIAYWNNRGEIIYVGRKDSQIKHNGYRIELGEIENAILATNLIKSTCVVYDNKNKQIVMFYVADSEVDLMRLRRELLKYVPKYMTPSKCLKIEEMPVNGNGKIDRLKLSGIVND